MNANFAFNNNDINNNTSIRNVSNNNSSISGSILDDTSLYEPLPLTSSMRSSIRASQDDAGALLRMLSTSISQHQQNDDDAETATPDGRFLRTSINRSISENSYLSNDRHSNPNRFVLSSMAQRFLPSDAPQPIDAQAFEPNIVLADDPRQQVGKVQIQSESHPPQWNDLPTDRTYYRPDITVLPRQIGPIRFPGANDVLSGRGGRINSHVGNVQFRNIVAQKKDEYFDPKVKKLEKAHIAAEIVYYIRYKLGGHFLLEDIGTGMWYDIGDKKAIRKAAQAMREFHTGLAKEVSDIGDIDSPLPLHAGSTPRRVQSPPTDFVLPLQYPTSAPNQPLVSLPSNSRLTSTPVAAQGNVRRSALISSIDTRRNDELFLNSIGTVSMFSNTNVSASANLHAVDLMRSIPSGPSVTAQLRSMRDSLDRQNFQNLLRIQQPHTFAETPTNVPMSVEPSTLQAVPDVVVTSQNSNRASILKMSGITMSSEVYDDDEDDDDEMMEDSDLLEPIHWNPNP